MLSATKFNTVAILEEVPGMHYADSVSFYQVSESWLMGLLLLLP